LTEQGRPPLKVGVGVNSGPVAVGNMGSDRLFDYTAIGDTVNLASRLEGLNKRLGTSIIVSRETCDAIGPGFTFKEHGEHQVRGWQRPVAVCELVDEAPQERQA
jgi:adenylate cyclase